MYLIDVIVPAYNVAAYIARCLESIMNQDITDPYRVIVVDDGSRDNTGEIVAAFEARYAEKIVYRRKENGGQSSARNLALDISDAKYVTFVDSDDYVESDFLSALYSLAKSSNADIAMCGMNRCIGSDGRGKRFSSGFNKDFITNDIVSVLKKSSFVPWNKLYKREVFGDLRFPVGMTYEDFALIPQVMYRAKTIAYVDRELYHYYVNPESTIMKTTKTKKTNRNIIKAQHILENSALKEEKDVLENFYVRRVIASMVWDLCAYREDEKLARQLVEEGKVKYPAILTNDAISMLPACKACFTKAMVRRHYFVGGV